MDTQCTMTPDSLRSFNRWHLIMALILLALLLLLPWTLGIGPNSWRDCVPAPRAAAAPAPPPAPIPEPIPTARAGTGSNEEARRVEVTIQP